MLLFASDRITTQRRIVVYGAKVLGVENFLNKLEPILKVNGTKSNATIEQCAAIHVRHINHTKCLKELYNLYTHYHATRKIVSDNFCLACEKSEFENFEISLNISKVQITPKELKI
jgi:hypothetical protein